MPKVGKLFRSQRWTSVAVLLICVVLGVLGSQLARELTFLRAAPNDNIQWTLAQVEVELLTLLNAVRVAGAAPGPEEALLSQVRTRFDIFYSRAATISNSPVFSELAADEAVSVPLQRLIGDLKDAVPLIDESDERLAEGLSDLILTFEQLRPTVRRLSLEGVREFADLSDNRRRKFAQLLFQTAGAGAFLIVALFAALAILFNQRRIADERLHEIRKNDDRYANTVNASLDAIIVANGAGTILDFNPAAETVFGYSRARAIGSDMADLIVPEELRDAHKRGMRRYAETGERRLVGSGRFEMDAKRSTGATFPVEMTIGVSEGIDGKPIFISYVRDIADRKRIETELRNARDQALAADTAKSQFLAVMSHEMRTPLNGVMAVLDLLEGSRLDSPQRGYVETAIASGEILQHQIDEILDLARIEAGAIDLRPTLFDIDELLSEVRRSHEVTASKRRNRIVQSVDLVERKVWLDRNRLRQVLLNLVGNAVKFTENGEIAINAADQEDDTGRRTITFSVVDTGIGIGEDYLESIFDDFVTLDTSYRRQAEGFGLGLAICRRITHAMDGTISVDSTPGVGSSFTLCIPESQSRPVSADSGTEPAQRLKLTGEGMSVLLVEDNETNRFVAKAMLEDEGCSVSEAADGLEGVEKAEAEAFDLILMDISMPNLDGLEAARRIRTGSGPCRDIPIVCLTAHAVRDEEDKMQAVGITDFLIKPLRRRNLGALLKGMSRSRSRTRTATPEPDASLVDNAVLDELRSVLTEEKHRSSIKAYCIEAEAMAAQLADAAGRGDLDEVRKLSHDLAGASALFGAVALARELRLVQEMAVVKDSEAVRAALIRLSALTSDTVAIIREV